MTAQRDRYIDFLRGTALLLLVVAHSSAPSLLMAVRTFDVPLMVFISALCFRSNRSYGEYCLRRLRRIYVPTALFLSILFALSFFLPIVPERLMTPRIIAGSYMLLNWPSIPFVWIMRVFLLVALALPVLQRACEHLTSLQRVAVAIVWYLVQSAVVKAMEGEGSGIFHDIVREYLLYLSGYSLIAFVALSCREASTRIRILLLGLCMVGVIIEWMISGSFDPQVYKYPPGSLYIAYGSGCSILLLMLRRRLELVASLGFWRYLSENSMWIYLWHTIPVFLMQNFDLFPEMWFARFVFVIVSALILNVLWGRLRSSAPEIIRPIME